MSDGIALLSTCWGQGQFLGIDTRLGKLTARPAISTWCGFSGDLVTRPRFIDLRQRQSLDAAIPERSRDFQSNPLVVACGETRALRIY